MTKKMPVRLKKAPIVESIFEFRYTSHQDISALLPGILHAQLNGEKQIRPTPPIPVDIIKADPNMQGVPTFSLEWGKFIILGNSFYVAVALTPPYSSWADEFRPGIIEIHNILLKTGLFSSINRYSIKYVDFIEYDNATSPMMFLNLNLSVHGVCIKNENCILQIELPRDKYMHVLKVATSAVFSQQNNLNVSKKGLLIDTDTLYNPQNPLDPNMFLKEHTSIIDDIHAKSKELFFMTLSDTGRDFLEPEYE